MYKATEFKALLWNANDGVREVSVSCVAGPKPFSSDPSEIGVQFQMRDQEDGSRPVAILFIDQETASRLASGSDLRSHVSYAKAFRGAIEGTKDL